MPSEVEESRSGTLSQLRGILRLRFAALRMTLFIEQIRAVFACALDCLLFTPLRDFCVISREQNVRNFRTTEVGRPRVLRRLQETVAEAVVRSRLLMAKSSRQ